MTTRNHSDAAAGGEQRPRRRAALAMLLGVMAGAVLVLGSTAGTCAAAEYAVIANAANPDAARGAAIREVVKRLFLKEQTNWPGGLPAKPLARPAGTPAADAFAAEVLGMSRTALDNHWLHLKQTKGETPPRAVGSVRILLRLVGKYPGAFSVVSAEQAASLPPGVTVVFTFHH